jgi:hypothetical protein
LTSADADLSITALAAETLASELTAGRSAFLAFRRAQALVDARRLLPAISADFRVPDLLAVQAPSAAIAVVVLAAEAGPVAAIPVTGAEQPSGLDKKLIGRAFSFLYFALAYFALPGRVAR